MGKKVVHKNMMHYVLNSLGISKEETFEYDFKAKLEKLLLDNKISGFIYRNVIIQEGKKIPVTVYGKLAEKQIQITFTPDNFKINTTPEELTNLPFLKYATHFLVVQYENENWQLFDRKIDAQFVTQTNIGERRTTTNPENRQIYIEFQDVDFKLNPNQEKVANRANNDLTNLANQIAIQLQNPFYQTVKMRVNIDKFNSNSKLSRSNNEVNFVDENNILKHESYSVANSDSLDDYEVAINIIINEDGSFTIKHELSEDYLQEYVEKWQEEADKRGLDVKVEELRQQVLNDFTNETTEKDFYDTFIQNVKAAFDEKIIGYIEAVQATQKIAKNVWAEGQVNESTWHSNTDGLAEEHEKWPTYVRLEPVIGGATDGVIDEVVGIPMAIKGIYGIATDAKQREAIKNLFTKEGLSNLLDGLKDEVEEIKNDEQKARHFGAKTVVAVSATVLGIGIISKSGKISTVIKQTTDKLKDFINPKATKLLQDLKISTRNVANELGLNKWLKNVDEDLIEDLIVDANQVALDKGTKLTFEQLQAFWKRGNDFNVKARSLDWYRYNELWLEHPTRKYPKGHKFENKSRRFRVDSYDKAGKGKIVSRKATDLSEIKFSTFERYCKEISEKYSIGSKIVRKEEGLGDALKGEYYLEIPESNKNFANINDYIKYAKELDPPVIIIFKPE